MVSPTTIPLSLTRFSFAQLRTCKERGEGMRTQSLRLGHGPPHGTQHPIRSPQLP